MMASIKYLLILFFVVFSLNAALAQHQFVVTRALVGQGIKVNDVITVVAIKDTWSYEIDCNGKKSYIGMVTVKSAISPADAIRLTNLDPGLAGKAVLDAAKAAGTPPAPCPPPPPVPPKTNPEPAKTSPPTKGQTVGESGPSTKIPHYLDCQELGNDATPEQKKKMFDCLKGDTKIKKKRIMLDPGHLGGTRSSGGFNDERKFKEYREGFGSLVVAQMTRDYLVNCLGGSPENILLTRENLTHINGKKEEALEQQGRTEPARTAYMKFIKPDIMISIHSNASLRGVKPWGTTNRPVVLCSPVASKATKESAENILLSLNRTFSPQTPIGKKLGMSNLSNVVSIPISKKGTGQSPYGVINAGYDFVESKDPENPKKMIKKLVENGQHIIVEGFFHDQEQTYNHLTTDESVPFMINAIPDKKKYPEAFKFYALSIANSFIKMSECESTIYVVPKK